MKKRYGDKVNVTEMITGEHENVSTANMVKGFDIELLDSYLDQLR